MVANLEDKGKKKDNITPLFKKAGPHAKKGNLKKLTKNEMWAYCEMMRERMEIIEKENQMFTDFLNAAGTTSEKCHKIAVNALKMMDTGIIVPALDPYKVFFEGIHKATEPYKDWSKPSGTDPATGSGDSKTIHLIQ